MTGAERGTALLVSQRNLVGEGVLCLGVQFIGVRVDDAEVGGVLAGARPSEIGPQRGSHQTIALCRAGGATIQGGLEVLRQDDNGLDRHGRNRTANNLSRASALGQW